MKYVNCPRPTTCGTPKNWTSPPVGIKHPITDFQTDHSDVIREIPLTFFSTIFSLYFFLTIKRGRTIFFYYGFPFI